VTHYYSTERQPFQVVIIIIIIEIFKVA